MSIKNIAPYERSTVQVGGVSDKSYSTGIKAVDKWGNLYIRAKVLPGTGSVTGAKYTVLYPITVGASITVGEFSHDMTDSDEHARGKIGVTQFSQMTAVTHYGWACVRGQTKYLTATTNTLWTAGVSLVISTTDNRLNNGARIATTSMVRDKVGISLEENGISTGGLTTGTTISIMLDGIGYGA